jgi:hypothetical protein
MPDWTGSEISRAPFVDFRHGGRLQKIVRRLAEHPGESVAQASTSDSKSQSVYRFWANEWVKPEQILASHRSRVSKRIEQHWSTTFA